jgi:hypothetical protein
VSNVSSISKNTAAVEVEVKVNLRPTASRPDYPGVRR